MDPMPRYIGRNDASFLGLPIELRLLICEQVIASFYCGINDRWDEDQHHRAPAIRLHLTGTGLFGADGYGVNGEGALVKMGSEGKPVLPGRDGHSPWAMSRVSVRCTPKWRPC